MSREALKIEESDTEKLFKISRNPELLQRPILETDDEAFIARPPEKIKQLGIFEKRKIFCEQIFGSGI